MRDDEKKASSSDTAFGITPDSPGLLFDDLTRPCKIPSPNIEPEDLDMSNDLIEFAIESIGDFFNP